MIVRNQLERQDRQRLQWTFWIIVFLIVYLPLEDFILKWLPLPNSILSGFRLLPELVCYLLFFRLLYQICTRRRPLKITSIEVLFICFLMWAGFLIIISILLFNASLFGGVSSLRTLIRFVSVYYLVVNLELSEANISLILQTIIGVGALEGLIATAQYFGGSPIKKIFEVTSLKLELKAQEGNLSPALLGVGKVGSSSGTFTDSSVFALFFLIPVILVVTWTIYRTYLHPKSHYFLLPNWKEILFLCLIYFGIFSTYKRAVLLISFALPILVLFYFGRTKISVWLAFLYGTLFLVLFWGIIVFNFNPSPTSSGASVRREKKDIRAYVIELFTPEYWNRSSEGSRLFFMKISCGNVLGSNYWYGLGPDENTTVEQLIKLTHGTRDKGQFQETSLYFKDAYWCAMISFYGVPGTLIYLLIIYQLYRSSLAVSENASEVVEKLLGVSASIIILLYAIYSLAEQLPEVRVSSFYFWTIAGLVVNVRHKQKIKTIKVLLEKNQSY
ncbi:hypothetical protein VB715_12295 [Crocosphaera sp. UHCC 0190]|uniref:hypothetical protein n=1 Tax=Crocosphaera sp. UHCC 0190 TaxID=3110246 RepID=UPI002B1F9E59|nr:hypothetical protein [Crocosphaera sp. UHCC 0190]MEA5510545.1 hypothetical protein [Crocosphaera sp. UHCC 0190]